ncbi:MAG: endonuclease/exonuclease/phosphatase family protein [Aquamicrobium sp.]|uniref:endonuclease/exonuclease/phosphatase family protein n=1 Tax=Aquamicrobium sp. TaxID=1872579 RepID=UPI00349E8A86|nr:endonuclease/exonuclease/phosphatase family protein [Aquamicrobium sp.]
MNPDPQHPRRGALALRLLALAAVAGLGAALTFGYLGRLHFAFDSFSHLRLHFAALLLLLVPALAALRFRAEALFALALGLAAPIQTVLFPPGVEIAEAEAGRATYRLMHLNLRYDNATPEAFLSLVGRTRPDAITLTEVSEPWAARLALIEAAYPYRIVCERPTFIGGAAILSRRPFVEGSPPSCGNRGAFAHASVDFGGRGIEIVALHMGWPWPFEQPWQIPRLEPLLGEVGESAIIAGDLNAVPWSHAARRLAAAADARILRGAGPTWLDRRLPAALIGWIGLPIDNIMVKGGIVAGEPTTLEDVGSDHLPMMLEFSLAPAREPVETVVANSE